MEFKSLKNIETNFRQIRMMDIVFVSFCALITGYALWSSYRFTERRRERIYILDSGKPLILALSQDLSQSRPVEAKERIRRFYELFFALSPGKAAIESNIRRALFLCDGSALRYYKDWKEKGCYNRIISANINQSIRVDSVVYDFNSYPYVVTTYARQSLVRLNNITERNLVAHCRLLNSVRSDNNPCGFTVGQSSIVGNRDLRTIERQLKKDRK